MKKRIRRSDAEWQDLINQQEDSGLSAIVFCRQQGLSSKTFYKRRQALQQNSKAITQLTKPFIKIQPTSVLMTDTQTTAVLRYQQSRLQLHSGVEATWVAELMKALS